MSESFETFANNLLQSQLHLVVGSTPESIRDEIIKSGLADNLDQAKAFVMACLVAAASVKKATDAFIADAKMSLARQAIAQVANLNGATNMSVLVLAGHCFMTTSFMNNVKFVVEFRKRMGQDHLWAGDFAAGSTSDKRKVILRQHKTKSTEAVAKAFGSGFFKYVKIDPHAMTDAERKFWKVAPSRSASPSRPSSRGNGDSSSDAGDDKGKGKAPGPAPETKTASSSTAIPGPLNVQITGKAPSVYKVPDEIRTYAAKALKQDDAYLAKRVTEVGIAQFEKEYRKLIKLDPNQTGTFGTSRIA